MPSRKEGWGLAVIEAAQHGVPTVGYRSSKGLTDSIVDGVTGLLVGGESVRRRRLTEAVAGPARGSRTPCVNSARRHGIGPENSRGRQTGDGVFDVLSVTTRGQPRIRSVSEDG